MYDIIHFFLIQYGILEKFEPKSCPSPFNYQHAQKTKCIDFVLKTKCIDFVLVAYTLLYVQLNRFRSDILCLFAINWN